ncbi:hypothetical protein KAS79_03450 [Candidatus Parcubacteria bacterium]|nr:hypothetical protein [Candidatus Parcubacteria bacterium]
MEFKNIEVEMMTNNWTVAEVYLQLAKKAEERGDFKIAGKYYELVGNVFKRIGVVSDALENYEKAEKMYNECGVSVEEIKIKIEKIRKEYYTIDLSKECSCCTLG